MRSFFLALVDVMEFPTTLAYSGCALTRAKYNVSRHFRNGKEKVVLLTRPNNVIHWENI
jgi:hypothetical protein